MESEKKVKLIEKWKKWEKIKSGKNKEKEKERERESNFSRKFQYFKEKVKEIFLV
jgi:hypothetical protein